MGTGAASARVEGGRRFGSNRREPELEGKGEELFSSLVKADPAEELLHPASISGPSVGVILVGGFGRRRRRMNSQKATIAPTNSAVPPITPPAIAPVCDLTDDDAVGSGTTAVGGPVIVDAKVDEEVEGVDVDVVGIGEIGSLDTPKHDTSVPFSTEKGSEVTVGPPAKMAENRYVPCVTFTLGHVHMRLDASRLDASSISAVARFSDVAVSVAGEIEGEMTRSKSAS